MVYSFDAALARERLCDDGRIEAGWYCFEHDASRVAHQAHRAREHKDRDDERRDGIEPIDAEERHAERGDDHRDGTQRVREQMPQRTAHVQVAVRVIGDDLGAAEVDEQPEHSDHRDRAGIDRARVREPPDRLDNHRDRSTEQQDGIRLGDEDFAATKSIRVTFGGRTLREPHRGVRGCERDDIRHHVRGVGEHGQRTERETADQFNDEKRGVRRERNQQGTSSLVDAVNYRVPNRSARAASRRNNSSTSWRIFSSDGGQPFGLTASVIDAGSTGTRRFDAS